jgi:hypothetical protein
VVAEKIKTARNPADEGLVGMLLPAQRFRCGAERALAGSVLSRARLILNSGRHTDRAGVNVRNRSHPGSDVTSGTVALARPRQWRAHRRRSGIHVRRDKAAFSSGCKTHPATAPAGSNRGRHGGDEMSGAPGKLASPAGASPAMGKG